MSPRKIMDLVQKGKKRKFIRMKAGRHHLNQVVKVDVTSNGKLTSLCLLTVCTKKDTVTCLRFCQKRTTRIHHEEASGKSNLGNSSKMSKSQKTKKRSCLRTKKERDRTGKCSLWSWISPLPHSLKGYGRCNWDSWRNLIVTVE